MEFKIRATIPNIQLIKNEQEQEFRYAHSWRIYSSIPKLEFVLIFIYIAINKKELQKLQQPYPLQSLYKEI